MNNTKTQLAQLFHHFPHRDFNFYNTTTLFTPDGTQYQQALMFNAVYLIFTTIILFSIFAIYFMVCSCYFCGNCSQGPLKPRPSRSRLYRLIIALLAGMSSAALGVGFYGNNKTQDGMKVLATSAIKVYNKFDLYKFEILLSIISFQKYLKIEEDIQEDFSFIITLKQITVLPFDISITVPPVSAIFQKNNCRPGPLPLVSIQLQIGVSRRYIDVALIKYLKNLEDLIKKPLSQLISLEDKLMSVNKLLRSSGNVLENADIDLKTWADIGETCDQYRWWALLGVLCWHLLLVLVVIYSACTERKCPFAVNGTLVDLHWKLIWIDYNIIFLSMLFIVTSCWLNYFFLEKQIMLDKRRACIIDDSEKVLQKTTLSKAVIVNHDWDWLTFMAVLSFFFMAASVSFEVPLGVAAGDLCMYPKASLLQYVKKPPSRSLVEYYLDCSNTTLGKLLKKPYKEADLWLAESISILSDVRKNPLVAEINKTQELLAGLERSLSSSKRKLDDLVSLLDCQEIHQEYQHALYGVCVTVLDGLGLCILTALITDFLIVLIMLCITPIWKAMAPLRPILKREKYGVHLVTSSYQGPPGGSESFQGDSSFDASYKSFKEDTEDFEHVPLVSKRIRPPSYRAIHGSTEFLSVEEDRGSNKEHTM